MTNTHQAQPWRDSFPWTKWANTRVAVVLSLVDRMQANAITQGAQRWESLTALNTPFLTSILISNTPTPHKLRVLNCTWRFGGVPTDAQPLPQQPSLRGRWSTPQRPHTVWTRICAFYLPSSPLHCSTRMRVNIYAQFMPWAKTISVYFLTL